MRPLGAAIHFVCTTPTFVDHAISLDAAGSATLAAALRLCVCKEVTREVASTGDVAAKLFPLYAHVPPQLTDLRVRLHRHCADALSEPSLGDVTSVHAHLTAMSLLQQLGGEGATAAAGQEGADLARAFYERRAAAAQRVADGAATTAAAAVEALRMLRALVASSDPSRLPLLGGTAARAPEAEADPLADPLLLLAGCTTPADLLPAMCQLGAVAATAGEAPPPPAAAAAAAVVKGLPAGPPTALLPPWLLATAAGDAAHVTAAVRVEAADGFGRLSRAAEARRGPSSPRAHPRGRCRRCWGRSRPRLRRRGRRGRLRRPRYGRGRRGTDAAAGDAADALWRPVLAAALTRAMATALEGRRARRRRLRPR